MTEVPEFDQFVEYVDSDGVHPVALGQHEITSLLTLQTLQRGYQHVTQLGRSHTIEDTTTLRSIVASTYHTDVADNEVVSDDPATITDRLVWVVDHPVWRLHASVTLGEVWLYEGNLYRAVQSHTVDSPDWTPDTTPALWVRFYTPAETPDWVQPTGAQDAWRLGQHVIHAGQEWVSDIDYNVWEPGVTGWSLVGGGQTDEWQAGVAYTGDNTAGAGNGDVVTYDGVEYRCLQSHTSLVGWEPPNVPALWTPV